MQLAQKSAAQPLARVVGGRTSCQVSKCVVCTNLPWDTRLVEFVHVPAGLAAKTFQTYVQFVLLRWNLLPGALQALLQLLSNLAPVQLVSVKIEDQPAEIDSGQAVGHCLDSSSLFRDE